MDNVIITIVPLKSNRKECLADSEYESGKCITCGNGIDLCGDNNIVMGYADPVLIGFWWKSKKVNIDELGYYVLGDYKEFQIVQKWETTVTKEKKVQKVWAVYVTESHIIYNN